MPVLHNSPLFGWWVFARRALEALSAPRADTAACDRAVEQLTRDSWLGSAADRSGATIGRAWRHSRLNQAASWLSGQLMPLPPAAVIRVAGWTIAVAGGTVLLLNATKPMPVGPLSWVVPAALAGAGLLLMAVAGPIALASGARE